MRMMMPKNTDKIGKVLYSRWFVAKIM